MILTEDERAAMTSKSLASLRETAAERLERYTSPTGLYAFRTYDVQGDVDAPLMPSDILMANLLSLKLEGRTSSLCSLNVDVILDLTSVPHRAVTYPGGGGWLR